jgi:multisubunit Na+/H+ antiporter MnhF subunit
MHHVLPSSSTMIGVCIGVITLVQVAKLGDKTYVDDVLAYDTLLFISACVLSYLSIRKGDHRRLELVADIAFLLGMLIMVFVGISLLELT